MKKIFLLLILSTIILYTQAQEEENDNIQTVFKSKPEKIRGFAGPLINIIDLDGKTAYMGGFSAGIIFNGQFILGIYELEMQNTIFTDNTNYIGYKMDFDHKGIWLGYIFRSKNVIHFNTNLQVGKGNLEVYDDINDVWLEDDFTILLTPSVEAEFNIAKFFRVGIGANYRFAFDVNELDNYDNNDFSGIGAFISFKFGWFR